MKKTLSLALAIILTMSLVVPTYALDSNDSPSPGDIDIGTDEAAISGVTAAESVPGEGDYTDGEASEGKGIVATTGSGIVAATASAIPPTKEELFAGYTLKDGLDKALYDKLEVISIEYVDHVFHHENGNRIDIPYCLKVTGTFGEKSVFGDDVFWNIYLPSADQFKGRFYQRLYPFNTSEVPYELPFTFSNGGYQVEYYELFKLNGSAIVADIGRTVAKNYYKYGGYIYGYAHGASGGSGPAIQMIEDKTYNVWDGGIAYVMTMPTTLSFNMGTGSDPIDGFRIVALRHRAEQIWDAMRPGGSGDPYAGLEDWERVALEEIERYGVPWFSWSGINANSQPFLLYNVMPAPPDIPNLESYVEDFWSKPGYLGTEQSKLGDWWRKLRDDGTFTETVLAQAAYHRHRNIDPALNVYTFDHLSQYPKIGNPVTSTSYTGNVQRKSMVIQSMEDGGAINWYADWYYQRVKDAGKQDMFRLYFNENAGHMGYTTDPNTVEYQGIVEQALADLAAWVERGVEPAVSTGYDRVRSQPVLKKGAAARQGYQPYIDFTVNDAERLVVTSGEAVHFVADIELPPKGGTVTSVEWDFLGNGDYVKSSFSPAPNGTVTAHENYTYTVLGTYFPRVRVTAHRDGIADTHIRFLQNIDRARVVVADATEIVATDKAALQIGYAPGESASGVTANLTLPLVGTSGASVAWVSDTPGTITTGGTVTRPQAGMSDKTVKLTAIITKGSVSDTKEFSLVVKALTSASSNSGSNRSSGSSTPAAQKTYIEVVVNGKTNPIATATRGEQDGKSKTTIDVNENTLNQMIEDALKQKAGTKAENIVEVLIKNIASDIVDVSLSGQAAKKMEDSSFKLNVHINNISYILPANEINISDIAKKLGTEANLKDIEISVKLESISSSLSASVTKNQKIGKYELVVPAVNFEITAASKATGKSVTIHDFSQYVVREFEIPSGFDPSKITTGVAVNPDGTVRHMPTVITEINKKYYARINSLSNSPYSVVSHPTEFADIKNHWAEKEINDMGSRMVIVGDSKGNFAPNSDITRAEFTAIIVTALGLKPGLGNNKFSDVDSTAWYGDYVKTATEYKIIAGYGNGKFGPMEKISREQAMAMIFKATEITGLKVDLTGGDITKLFADFNIKGTAAGWSKTSIAACIKSGLVSQKDGKMNEIKGNISRAEVAVIVRNLLQKSGLIN